MVFTHYEYNATCLLALLVDLLSLGFVRCKYYIAILNMLSKLAENISLVQFSIACRKSKTKLITLTNQKRHTSFNVPIKTRNKCTWLTQNAGKRSFG